jgi:hypothetical protein
MCFHQWKPIGRNTSRKARDVKVMDTGRLPPATSKTKFQLLFSFRFATGNGALMRICLNFPASDSNRINATSCEIMFADLNVICTCHHDFPWHRKCSRTGWLKHCKVQSHQDSKFHFAAK